MTRHWRQLHTSHRQVAESCDASRWVRLNAPMDWTGTLPALLGTVVGGAVTVTGQTLADRRKDSSTIQEETRTARRAEVERSRAQVRELHDKVSEDIAWVRGEVMAAEDALNLARAQILDPVYKEMVARHDRAASLIAVVFDGAVRAAADAVYTAWASWLAGEVEAMINAHANLVDPKGAIESGTNFASAVREYLGALNRADSALSTS